MKRCISSSEYMYPAGSPVYRLKEYAGDTTVDFETTASSVDKATANIRNQIADKYNVNVQLVRIDKDKIERKGRQAEPKVKPQPNKDEFGEQITIPGV